MTDTDPTDDRMDKALPKIPNPFKKDNDSDGQPQDRSDGDEYKVHEDTGTPETPKPKLRDKFKNKVDPPKPEETKTWGERRAEKKEAKTQAKEAKAQEKAEAERASNRAAYQRTVEQMHEKEEKREARAQKVEDFKENVKDTAGKMAEVAGDAGVAVGGAAEAAGRKVAETTGKATQKVGQAVGEAVDNAARGVGETIYNAVEEGKAAKQTMDDVKELRQFLQDNDGLDPELLERAGALARLSDNEYNALREQAIQTYESESGEEYDDSDPDAVKNIVDYMYDNLSDDQKGRVYEGHAQAKDLTAMTTVRSRHANEALKALTEVAATNIGSATSKGWDLAQGLVKMTFTNPHALSSSGRAIGLAVGSMELAGDLAEKAAKQYGVNVDGNEPLKEDTLKYRLYMRAKKHGAEAVGNTFHAISRSLDGLGVDDIRQLTPDQLQQHLRDMQAEKNRLLEKIQDDDAARAKARGRWGGINNEALDVNLHPDEHGALSRDDRGLVMAQINHLSKYMDSVSKQAKNLDRMETQSRKLVGQAEKKYKEEQRQAAHRSRMRSKNLRTQERHRRTVERNLKLRERQQIEQQKRAEDERRQKAQQVLGDGTANRYRSLLEGADPKHKWEINPQTGLPESTAAIHSMYNYASGQVQHARLALQNEKDPTKKKELSDRIDELNERIKEISDFSNQAQENRRRTLVENYGEAIGELGSYSERMPQYMEQVWNQGIWPSSQPTNKMRITLEAYENNNKRNKPAVRCSRMWRGSMNTYNLLKDQSNRISRLSSEDLERLHATHTTRVDDLDRDLKEMNEALQNKKKLGLNPRQIKKLRRTIAYTEKLRDQEVRLTRARFTPEEVHRDTQRLLASYKKRHKAMIKVYDGKGRADFDPRDPEFVKADADFDALRRELENKYWPETRPWRKDRNRFGKSSGGFKPSLRKSDLRQERVEAQKMEDRTRALAELNQGKSLHESKQEEPSAALNFSGVQDHAFPERSRSTGLGPEERAEVLSRTYEGRTAHERPAPEVPENRRFDTVGRGQPAPEPGAEEHKGMQDVAKMANENARPYTGPDATSDVPTDVPGTEEPAASTDPPTGMTGTGRAPVQRTTPSSMRTPMPEVKPKRQPPVAPEAERIVPSYTELPPETQKQAEQALQTLYHGKTDDEKLDALDELKGLGVSDVAVLEEGVKLNDKESAYKLFDMYKEEGKIHEAGVMAGIISILFGDPGDPEVADDLQYYINEGGIGVNWTQRARRNYLRSQQTVQEARAEGRTKVTDRDLADKVVEGAKKKPRSRRSYQSKFEWLGLDPEVWDPQMIKEIQAWRGSGILNEDLDFKERGKALLDFIKRAKTLGTPENRWMKNPSRRASFAEEFQFPQMGIKFNVAHLYGDHWLRIMDAYNKEHAQQPAVTPVQPRTYDVNTMTGKQLLTLMDHEPEVASELIKNNPELITPDVLELLRAAKGPSTLYNQLKAYAPSRGRATVGQMTLSDWRDAAKIWKTEGFGRQARKPVVEPEPEPEPKPDARTRRRVVKEQNENTVRKHKEVIRSRLGGRNTPVQTAQASNFISAACKNGEWETLLESMKGESYDQRAFGAVCDAVADALGLGDIAATTKSVLQGRISTVAKNVLKDGAKAEKQISPILQDPIRKEAYKRFKYADIIKHSDLYETLALIMGKTQRGMYDVMRDITTQMVDGVLNESSARKVIQADLYGLKLKKEDMDAITKKLIDLSKTDLVEDILNQAPPVDGWVAPTTSQLSDLEYPEYILGKDSDPTKVSKDQVQQMLKYSDEQMDRYLADIQFKIYKGGEDSETLTAEALAAIMAPLRFDPSNVAVKGPNGLERINDPEVGENFIKVVSRLAKNRVAEVKKKKQNARKEQDLIDDTGISEPKKSGGKKKKEDYIATPDVAGIEKLLARLQTNYKGTRVYRTQSKPGPILSAANDLGLLNEAIKTRGTLTPEEYAADNAFRKKYLDLCEKIMMIYPKNPRTMPDAARALIEAYNDLAKTMAPYLINDPTQKLEDIEAEEARIAGIEGRNFKEDRDNYLAKRAREANAQKKDRAAARNEIEGVEWSMIRRYISYKQYDKLRGAIKQYLDTFDSKGDEEGKESFLATLGSSKYLGANLSKFLPEDEPLGDENGDESEPPGPGPVSPTEAAEEPEEASGDEPDERAEDAGDNGFRMVAADEDEDEDDDSPFSYGDGNLEAPRTADLSAPLKYRGGYRSLDVEPDEEWARYLDQLIEEDPDEVMDDIRVNLKYIMTEHLDDDPEDVWELLRPSLSILVRNYSIYDSIENNDWTITDGIPQAISEILRDPKTGLAKEWYQKNLSEKDQRALNNILEDGQRVLFAPGLMMSDNDLYQTVSDHLNKPESERTNIEEHDVLNKILDAVLDMDKVRMSGRTKNTVSDFLRNCKLRSEKQLSFNEEWKLNKAISFLGRLPGLIPPRSDIDKNPLRAISYKDFKPESGNFIHRNYKGEIVGFCSSELGRETAEDISWIVENNKDADVNSVRALFKAMTRFDIAPGSVDMAASIQGRSTNSFYNNFRNFVYLPKTRKNAGDIMTVVHELGHAADHTDPNGAHAKRRLDYVNDAIAKYEEIEVPESMRIATGIFYKAYTSEAFEKAESTYANVQKACRRIIGTKIGVEFSSSASAREIGEILAETTVEWENDPEVVDAWEALQDIADELNSIAEAKYEEMRSAVAKDIPSEAEYILICDILDALRSGDLFGRPLPAGHGRAYYTRDKWSRRDEIVANYFALSICSPHGVKLLNEMVPDLVSALKRYVAELAR